MTASLLVPAGHPAIAALHDYLAEITSILGIGPESCTIDHDIPVSAYIALDERLPAHPDCDLALLWDETHGWSAAIEDQSSDSLVVVRYLGGTSIAPPPAHLARFVDALRRGDHTVGIAEPPVIRTATFLADLDAELRARTGNPNQ